MKKGPITIKDIAQELNISISTVSRALADNNLVKKSTRVTVQELARKYNYQPNFTAISLKKSKTNTIGVIIPQIVHDFFSMVIRGIEDYTYGNGYSVIICSSHESYEREVTDTRTLLNGRVDGLLACMSKNTQEFSHFKEFVERDVPLVFFDCICDEIPTSRVVIDDYNAGFRATRHLIEQGCRNIAYVGGPISLNINQDRFAGYNSALSEAKLNTQDDWIVHCETGSFEDGLISTKTLTRLKEVDGIFAGTDMIALAAIKNLKSCGFKVPEDVAVIGFSNWSISQLYEPAISTVDQPGYEMGKKAAEMLINQIQNPDHRLHETVVLQTEILPRDSSNRFT